MHTLLRVSPLARLLIPPFVLGLAAVLVLSGEWHGPGAPAAAQSTPTAQAIVAPSVTPGAPASTPTPSGTPPHETLTTEEAWNVVKKGLPVQTPTADSLFAHLQSEASILMFDLQWATGSITRGNPCSLDFDRGRVLERTISRCAASIDADMVRATPEYDVKKHEAILGAFTDACSSLKTAENTLGRPSDSVGWRQVALSAQARLQPVVVSGIK